MHKLDIALVGCGFIANEHVRIWHRMPQTRVVAVCDINEKLASQFAHRWKIPSYYTQLSELLEQDAQLIDICTPPRTHASLAVQAMEKGRHVLLEKPLAMTTKEADVIVRCQKAKGVRLGVIHNILFEPPVLKACSIVEKGRVGEVIGMQVDFLHTIHDAMLTNTQHWCHRLPAGRFGEMLAHPIYLLRHFLGDLELENVEAYKVGHYPWMPYDELHVTLQADGRLGKIYVSFNSPRDALFLTIYGRKSIIRVDVITTALIEMPPLRLYDRFGKGRDPLRQAYQLLISTAKNSAKIIFKKWRSGHETYMRLFVDSLLGEREPPVSIQDTYKTTEVLEEICERLEQKS